MKRGTEARPDRPRVDDPDRPMRLGFAVKVMGRADLKSNDARRHAQDPHLRVSLGYVSTIFDYLDAVDLRFYRLSSELAPYCTHPDLPRFHRQVSESRAELEALGAKARSLGLRLSFHPSQYVLLNALDPKVVAQSIADFLWQAEVLDAMGMGPEAVLVTHVGGTYGDKAAGRQRWVDRYRLAPEPVRRRLVLENDDIRYSAADVLWVHEQCGVPLVFDHQHHWRNNPEGTTVRAMLARFLASWPPGVRPKIHYSSPRTELRTIERKDPKTGKKSAAWVPPIWTGHADYVNPIEFGQFLDVADGLPPFDVMVEAKAKDVAVLRLLDDVRRFAPAHAWRFGQDTARPGETHDDVAMDDVTQQDAATDGAAMPDALNEA